ncbi:bifunctional 3-(3-hydroxy-phenyl)propionate/3-hydroxycinnamic acid hydroxylase [Streptomyces sp. NPDC048290]|uniref:bifunctional 3-(3-hydroxy-phenyl)propionate/3-hydroxycinnamic acid hydroxylase MhpA n=1 Tax=Streptomyces sp. NPDC048290 TaxID=3155811 RepID=UPI0034211EDF
MYDEHDGDDGDEADGGPDTEAVDVVIIGYGPVGQATAALLGSKGHRVAVFERWPSLYGLARAGHVDHEIMRIFQSLGAAEAVERDAHLADQYVFRNGSGETLMAFDYGAKGVSGWRSDYIVYQPRVEDALHTAVRACPTVTVHQGWEAIDVRQNAEGIEVDVREVEYDDHDERTGAGRPRTVRARYLVAADGANSAVRSALDIAWHDLGFRSTWLVVDLVPTGPMSFDFDNGQVCDPARPHCLFQLGKDHRRFEFAALPGEDPARLTEEKTAWELMARYDVTPANARIERQAVYTFGSCVAERWHSGRVFLVGDAAHLMPPFMGQGMCTGIRDAMNLTWRLDAVLTGRQDEELLTGYETERSPHAETLVRMSIAAGQVSCTFDPDIAAARDEAFRTGTAPPVDPFPALTTGLLAGRSDRLSGRLAPQGRIRLGERTGLFDDVAGRGWVLLSTRPVPGPADAPVRGHLDRIGLRTVVIDATADVDGFYAAYFKAEDVTAILYRPDFYVFGSARHADDVPALLERLAAMLPQRSGDASGPDGAMVPRRLGDATGRDGAMLPQRPADASGRDGAIGPQRPAEATGPDAPAQAYSTQGEQ